MERQENLLEKKQTNIESENNEREREQETVRTNSFAEHSQYAVLLRLKWETDGIAVCS